MPPLSPDRPLRKRLTLCAFALALFLLTLLLGHLASSDNRSPKASLGYDFLAFYTAGHFLHTHQPDKIYDLDAVRQFQYATARSANLDLDGHFGPFWNPPFYALPFAPLSALPYRTALQIWWAINLLCLAASLLLLTRMLPPTEDWRTKSLLVLLVLISLPTIQAFCHGQNTFTSLLLLTATVSLWRTAAAQPTKYLHLLPFSPSPGTPGEGRGEGSSSLAPRLSPLAPSYAFIAGLTAGLLFYKPQLALLVAILLTLTLGRRALLGLLVTTTALALLTCLTMPDLLASYLHRLPANLRQMQEQSHYLWERHITLKAFWRHLLQSHHLGPTSTPTRVLWGLSLLALAAPLASAAHRAFRSSLATSNYQLTTSSLISATILSMPLLMPFYFDYDLLLMAVPAVLFASELCSLPRGTALPTADRWLIRLWTLFYLWTFASPGLAGLLHVHLAVPLLGAIALLHIRRACRREEITSLPLPRQPPSPLAAAA